MRSLIARHHFSPLMACHISAESRAVETGLASQPFAEASLSRLIICRCILATADARSPAADLRSEVMARFTRSEEHTSELQSQSNLVCRLLLEKKNTRQTSS